MIAVSIGGRGVKAYERVLGVNQEVLGDLKPILDASVAPYMLEHMRRQFDTLGAHSGQPWATLKGEPLYYAFKKRILGKGLADKPLWWSRQREQLRPSLTDPAHGHHAYRSGDNGALFGTTVPHAQALLDGGVGPFGEDYPARNFFHMSQGQRKELTTLIQREVIREADRRGVPRSMIREQF